MTMLKHMLLVGGVICLSASTHLAAGDLRMVLVGDRSAQLVCAAVINDDIALMRREFKRAARDRQAPWNRYHKYYSCNDMRLIDFAYQWESTKIIGYLEQFDQQHGVVTMMDMAAR